jgi:uncharacterized protein (DUF1684 family)
MLMAANSGDYAKSIEGWRAAYEQGLKAPEGWLSVAGLFWLKEGANRVGSAEGNAIRLPARCARELGAFEFRDGRATFRPAAGAPVMVNGKTAGVAELKDDHGQAPDVVRTGDVSLTVIRRGKRFGIRMRDPRAETVRGFKGGQWYPVNAAYRVHAVWHAYDASKMVPITNILGDTEGEPSPGYATFKLNGKEYKLEPVVEDPGELFFLFRDATSAHETYGAGRFLKAAMPKDGAVELDFNKAYNPPCAYIAFATCPLPPRQNHLDTRVEAGQKRYESH